MGPGENRGVVLRLGSPPHCNRTHSCAASETHALCLTSKLPKIPSPAASLSLAYKTPEGREPAPSPESEGP